MFGLVEPASMRSSVLLTDEFWLGDDAAVTATRAEARIMFRAPRLLPWAGVLANVKVGLSAAAGAVGLDGRADNWPSFLSGGQKQRTHPAWAAGD